MKKMGKVQWCLFILGLLFWIAGISGYLGYRQFGDNELLVYFAMAFIWAALLPSQKCCCRFPWGQGGRTGQERKPLEDVSNRE